MSLLQELKNNPAAMARIKAKQEQMAEVDKTLHESLKEQSNSPYLKNTSNKPVEKLGKVRF